MARTPAVALAALCVALPLAAAPPARAAGAAPPTGAPGETVVVKREGARLMRAARFYGTPCAARVEPGRAVKVLQRQRGWARIAAPGAGACWLHESAWSDRQPGALAGAAPASSQRDVELAARGFSEEEVARVKGERPDLAAGFAAVEAHLARGAEPSAEELTRFAAEGGLGGGR
jgi:hypothetical protein